MDRRLEKPIIRITIIALALGGVWVCGTLVRAHGGEWAEGSAGSSLLASLCNSVTFPSVRCEEVVDSRWGSVDFTMGMKRVVVPTSLIGLAYFLSIAIWFALVPVPNRKARWIRTAVLTALSLGLLGSIFLMVVMAVSLGAWCPLCVIAHLANGLVFVCALRLHIADHGATTDRPASSREASPYLAARVATALVAILVSSTGLWLYYEASSTAKRYWQEAVALEHILYQLKQDEALLLDQYYAAEYLQIPLRNNAAHNNRNASFATMVVFSNFDCSACSCFGWQWQRMIEPAFKGRLIVDHRHYVPESADPVTDNHYESRRERHMAYAAEAARLQGGEPAFRAMHNLLFRHRKVKPEPDYADLAKRIRLDVPRFLGDMRSDRVRRTVQEDTELAAQVGIHQAPAVFLNGRRVPDLCLTSRAFWELMASELSREQTRTVSRFQVDH